MRAVRRGGLVEQVIAEIAGQIDTGTWPPGHRLPSVAELAVELDVGRSTVREAVQALAHRGVLDVVQGRGTFVTPAAGDALRLQRTEALDVYEARRGLEVEAARLAALRRDDDDLVALRRAAATRREARSAGVVSEWAAADLELHRAVFAATHNPVLQRLFDTLADAQIVAFTRQTHDPGSSVDTSAEHDALVVAVSERDPLAAMTAARGYLEACEADLRALLDPS